MSETKEAEIAHIKSEVNSPKHRLLELLSRPRDAKAPQKMIRGLESALNAMAFFVQLDLRGRISFDYSPDFRTLFVNLHRVFTSYFLLRLRRPNESFVADALI